MDDKDFLYVMYMGGPDSIQSIEPFLYNLFTDRDIIDLVLVITLKGFWQSLSQKEEAKRCQRL